MKKEETIYNEKLGCSNCGWYNPIGKGNGAYCKMYAKNLRMRYGKIQQLVLCKKIQMQVIKDLK